MRPRLSDWQERLARYLHDAKRGGLAFDWSEMSCAKFVAGAVAAQTGHNYHEPFEGAYSDPHTANVALKQFGWNSLLEYLREEFPEVPPALAQYGDIIAVEARGTPETGEILEGVDSVEAANSIPSGVRVALGVVEQPYYWVLTPQGMGLGKVLGEGVITAFRVGAY